MPEITGWIHPRTGKFYKTKGGYRRVLKKEAAENLRKRKTQLYKNNLASTLREGISACRNVQEICDFIMENQHDIQVSGVLNGCFWGSGMNAVKQALEDGKEVIFPELKFIGISMTYSATVSNTHCSPRGNPRNFKRENHLPTSYPGFTGRIALQSDSGMTKVVRQDGKVREYHGGAIDSNIVSSLGINTGTGGSAGPCGHGYDVKIFLDDFPLINEFVTKAEMWRNLKEDSFQKTPTYEDIGYGKTNEPIAPTYGSTFGCEF